ncbi:MAG: molybdopterin-binding protein [Planctomycetota bacterium]
MHDRPLAAEVIAIGDELTSGQRLDTNSQWLSQQLGDVGVEVAYHTTVGDDLRANAEVFRTAIARADVVVSTGGLGPTADDLTREALAAAAGVDLLRDAGVLEHIRGMFTSRGRTMPEQNQRQADFPAGSRPIQNPGGTAPGVWLEVERAGRVPCRVFALPGVPAEMHAMWRQTVAPAVVAASPERRIVCHRRLKCFGVGESHLEAMLPDVIRRGRQPRVGITVSGATITLRVTAAGPDEAAARAAIDPTLILMRDKLGTLVFGEEDDELEHAVTRLLAARGKTLITSEAWTQGLVAGWLAAAGAPAESRVGGKRLAKAVAVDEVSQIATDARQQAGADFGLAVGGLADTPADDDSVGADPASRVAVALAYAGGVSTKHFPLIGHPSIVRPRIAKAALNLLRLHLLGDA